MKIETEYYEYESTCGCCSDWGYKLFIDGVEQELIFTTDGQALAHVLESLGHQVSERFEPENEEDDDN